MIHHKICLKNKEGELHRVEWDYKNPEFSDDHEALIFNGECECCLTEFQKTYSNPLFSIISNQTRESSNFEDLMEHLN